MDVHSYGGVYFVPAITFPLKGSTMETLPFFIFFNMDVHSYGGVYVVPAITFPSKGSTRETLPFSIFFSLSIFIHMAVSIFYPRLLFL